MADLISRAAAIKAFMGKPPEYYHTSYIVGELNCVPAVDAVPVVHGSWIEGNGGDDVCSACGKECSDFVEGCDGIKYTEYLPNYCPNCGAKMDGERRENE